MVFIGNLYIAGWLFFLVHGLEFHTRDPSDEEEKNGICSILQCLADNRTIVDASHLESLSVYNHSRLNSKSVVATISAFQSHLSTDCKKHKVGVSGNFSSQVANIRVSISDQSACQSGVLTCELKYVNTEGEGHVVDSVIQLGQNSNVDTDVLLTKAYLNDVVDAITERLSDRLDRLDSCNMREQNLPHYTTCDRPFTSLPREIITMPNYMRVLCDTKTDGGNWIIFQRRAKGNVNFTRNWTEYKNGFGDLLGDFWLGNEKIHQLTTQNTYKLRIDFTLKNKTDYYAEYASVSVSSESDGYRIDLGTYTGGTVPDHLSYCNHGKFSTPDKDNDQYRINCADNYHQGWWFKDCHKVALNGPFNSENIHDVDWRSVSSLSNPIDFTEMKMRPIK